MIEYELKSKTNDKNVTLYYIQRPDKSVVNNICLKDRDKVKGYLDRLVAMGYCKEQ